MSYPDDLLPSLSAAREALVAVGTMYGHRRPDASPRRAAGRHLERGIPVERLKAAA